MNANIPLSHEPPAEVADGLADPSIAALMKTGAPVLVATASPFAVIWANEAAYAFFEVDDNATLTAKLLASVDPGARRLRELAGILLPGAPARLERLRFFIDGHAQMITFLCRRTVGSSLLVAGAMGVRPQPRIRTQEAQPPFALVATTGVVGVIASAATRSEAATIVESQANAMPAMEPVETALHVAPAPTSEMGEITEGVLESAAPAITKTAADAEAADEELALNVLKERAPTQSERNKALQDVSVAPVAVATRDLSSLRAVLAEKYRGASRLRFLWRSDASGRLADIGDALKDVVGGAVTGFEDAPASALFETIGSDQGKRLVDLLARRESFAPVEVNWPLNDVAATVPVAIGALPAFDRDRRFDGFKGFGVIHLDRLAEIETAPDADEGFDETEVPSEGAAGDAVTHADASRLAEVVAHEPSSEEDSESSPVTAPNFPGLGTQTSSSISAADTETRALAPREIEDDSTKLETEQVDPADGAPEADESDEAHELVAEQAKPMGLHFPVDEQPGATGDAARGGIEAPVSSANYADSKLDRTENVTLAEAEAELASEDSDQISGAEQTEPEAVLKLVSEGGESPVREMSDPDVNPLGFPDDAPAARASNVVTLRPFQTQSRPASAPEASPAIEQPSLPPVATLEPAQQTEPVPAPIVDPGISLSPTERNAFREIARALGAKVKTEPELAAEKARAEERVRAAEMNERAIEASLDPVQAKREETARSLARIRDLLQVSTANDDVESAETVVAAEPLPSLSHKPAFATASLEANAPGLFDRLPIGVLVSRGGVPIHANRNLLDALGYRDADALHEAGGIERMFRGREPDALTREADGGAIPVVSSNGDVTPFDVRIQTMEWGGEPASVMTFRRSNEQDLQQRIKTLEMDARQREAETRELHAILDTATDGVVVIDNSGRILALNRSAEALFGYEQNEIAGEPFRSLLAGESHAAAEDYLNGLKQNGVASVLNDGREIIGRARQGGPIPMFMTLGRVGAGDASKFCAVLRDITQWKKAERELKDARRDAERASALKSDFLAKISHEIRTPLNAILGFAEVIMDERFGPVGNERYKDYLKDIHSSGTHVMSLVNDLLDLSKIEAGKIDLNFGAVDANKVIAECASLMQTQAVRERVIVRMALAPRLPQIVADERSLKQIVLNLLSNALKFNEPGGQVIISTALTDAGNAVLRIKDTGIGMTEAEVETALEPFRQIATSRQTTGTGLGLPLTKALVEANRASFVIKSRKHEGTLVEVSFPSTRVLAE